MRKILFTFLILFLAAFSMYAQDIPQISFEELRLAAEEDFSLITEAREETETLGTPHTIYTVDGVFIEALGIEDNRVVYGVMHNLLDIYADSRTAFYEEISSTYDLSTARLHFVNKPTQNPTLGFPEESPDGGASTFLMIPESSNDAIMTFNATNGDLINASFVVDPTNLSTPINSIISPDFSILLSDQLDDHVVQYDSAGGLTGIFAGGYPDTLNNLRGIAYTPDLSSILVTVASGANSDAVAQFDLSGAYLGNFITPNSAITDGPFDITFRTTDCLVPASTSDNIVSYDLTGNFLGNFVASINFPEQVNLGSGGTVLAAGFSTPSGLYIYDASGTQLNFFSNVTGLRGCWELPNGNYLVTNGAGVHELDGSGNVVRQIVAGVSARFIELYDPAMIPVELTSFAASVNDGNVVLNWSTATEVNNSGFEIERSSDNNSFNKIAFVPGFGTTTETKSYSYTDNSVNSGTYYYRLKQVDLDGTFSYSETVEVDVIAPEEFALEQNYPNPFNPSTSIKFSIPVESKVTIKLYNLIGEQVSEVINNDFAAGTHTINFNAVGLTSGIYLYKLEAAGLNGELYNDVKKMTLLK